MFFIFGISPKTINTQSGQFLCPVCKTRYAYEIKEQRSYFSLFFIPVFPVGKPKQGLVKCLHCGTEMPPMVLEHNT
nr:zinc-ribbon domain-containing protein [Acinetobacter sp. Marseille-Q1620]